MKSKTIHPLPASLRWWERRFVPGQVVIVVFSEDDQ